MPTSNMSIPPRHGNSGSNYIFADGHCKTYDLASTLDNANFMWGRKVYTCIDKPTVQDNNGN